MTGKAQTRPKSWVPRLVLPPLMLIALINIYGLRYYVLPLHDRVRHPLNDVFSPSGTVGQSTGILAFALFLFLWLYPIRKQFSFLAFTGSVPRWLEVHIAAGLLIPVLGATHAGWRFTGVIGLGYLAMLLVAFSGVIGRYLYVRIPRARNGAELSVADIRMQGDDLIADLSLATNIDIARLRDMLTVDAGVFASRNPLTTIRLLIVDDFRRGRVLRSLQKQLREGNAANQPLDKKDFRRAMKLARRELKLSHQIRALDATRRVFRLWHVAHRPFAVTALLAVVLHVAVVVVMGATWFW